MLILAVTVNTFVFLLRDREGEDTHQNVIHDTVLSFGKVTYSTLYVIVYTAAVKVKLAFLSCRTFYKLFEIQYLTQHCDYHLTYI